MITKSVYTAFIGVGSALVALLICAAVVGEPPLGEEMAVLGPGIVMIGAWVILLISAPLWGRSYAWWSRVEPRALRPWLLFPLFFGLGSLTTALSLTLLLTYVLASAA